MSIWLMVMWDKVKGGAGLTVVSHSWLGKAACHMPFQFVNKYKLCTQGTLHPCV